MKNGLMRLLKEKAKNGEQLDPANKDAKMKVLDALDQMMDDEDAPNLKKVTVASDSPEGLIEGLDVAQETMEEVGEDGIEAIFPEEGMEEGCIMEDEMSKEDQIAELKAQLAELEG